MSEHLPRAMRSDALASRERVLEAAARLFAADGLNATMRDVARQAGVGPATVYRHFPTKRLLVTEVFKDQMGMCHAIVAEGLAEPDPWRGLCLVIEKICELHARNRGFTDAFMAAFPDAIDFAADRRATLGSIAELALRAKATGRLRADFVPDDLILMLTAHRGLHAVSAATRISASRRFAAFAIHAFQAPAPPAD